MQYTYDATNRLAEIKQYQDGTQPVRTTILTWDEAHNLTAWSDTDATRPLGQQTASGTATYDDANRKTGETVTYPNPSGQPYSLSYSYQYSLAGKKTRLTWADGTEIDYGYSAHGEGIISVSQFNWMAPASVILPGGSVQNTAVRWINRKVDLPWQSTNKRSLKAVMFRDITGLFEMAVCCAKPPYAATLLVKQLTLNLRINSFVFRQIKCDVM